MERYLESAIALSTKQNNGKPVVDRFCQPEFKICTIAVSFVMNNGKKGFLKTVEDMNGKIVRRESCQFNEFNDIRTCLNWDTGASHRDMKDIKGDWSKIADE
jgi:hypothetical protein